MEPNRPSFFLPSATVVGVLGEDDVGLLAAGLVPEESLKGWNLGVERVSAGISPLDGLKLIVD